MASFVLRLLTPTRGARAAALTFILFVLGAVLAFTWLLGDFGWQGMAVCIPPLAAAAAVSIWPERFSNRALRASQALVVFIHLFWLVGLSLLVALLAWSVSGFVWMVVFVLAAAAFVGAAASTPPFRLPSALPIGLAICALLSGWMREDGLIRCDDYLRLIESGGSVVVPSTPEIASCQPGESIIVARYPRRFWEFADGSGFLVTTSRGEHSYTFGRRRTRVAADWFTGAVCQVANGGVPECFGTGKGDGLTESRRWNRLLVLAHASHHATLYVLPLTASPGRLAEVDLSAAAGNLFVDDDRDVIGMFEDQAEQLYRARIRDLSPLETLPANFAPDQVHYDQERHEGIACAATGPRRLIGGEAYSAIAFKGDPFTHRPLAGSTQYPLSWLSATFGCDWDPAARRAYVAVASLGLLLQVDYDSGAVLKSSFIGFGGRPVRLDAARGKVFIAFFLSGDVISVELESGRIVDRRNVGRFVRNLVLSHDRSALLASSTLGVVRLPLSDPRT